MIYYVEDDTNIRDLTIYALKQGGFEAEGFERADEFYAAVRRQVPELVLLDIMLPEVDGLEILRELRNNPATKHIPIMMLTAKGTEYDTVCGLDAGADDYLAKPFGMMELVSRIKAVLRRSGKTEDRLDMETAGVHVNVKKHEVTVNGKEVLLTLKEFELLEKLMRNQGIVLTRDQLLTEIWGYDFDGETRTVDVHIRTLRQKLGEKGEIIQTVRGVGYRVGGTA